MTPETQRLQSPDDPGATGPHRKVFIMDDHPLVREWLTNLINRQPGLVVSGEAATVPEATQKIAGSKPDLAIVDLSLAGASGLALITELKRLYPGVPILVLSMHEGLSYIERALQAGASGYVMKREASAKVIEAIRRVLAGVFYVSTDTGQVLAARLVGGNLPANPSAVEQLSDREQAVFALLGEGRNVPQIADQLQVDAKTIHTYCARVRKKLQLGSTTELLRAAFRWQESRRSP